MAETSTQQMALVRDVGPGGFMERVAAMLSRGVAVVLSEPMNTPYHPARAGYAQRIVLSPQNAAAQAGPQVVMGVNVIATTTYDEVTKTSVCTIADIDLESQIMTLWNSLAGIDSAN